MFTTAILPASARTAKRRRKLSKPTAYLVEQELLVGETLDYGCGTGFDAMELGLAKYDLYWHNDKSVLMQGKYNTIICNYVLNVIPSVDERNEVVNTIYSLLKPGGLAYISVRNDSEIRNGYTQTGSWQGKITLQLPLQKTCRLFTMYLLAKPGEAAVGHD